MSCGASLYKHHEVSIVGHGPQIERSRLITHCYDSSYTKGEKLISLLEKQHFDVLLPISDLTVPFASQNKMEIERRFGVKCAVADYQQVCQVSDKSLFMSFCKDKGIPHPDTCSLSEGEIERAALEVGFPALIKPDFSVGARGITRVNSFEELCQKLPVIQSRFGSCSLQELIDNLDYYYNVMLYRSKDGRIISSAVIKIVRMYPIAGGSSSCCISVENEELTSICADCLDKIGWVGMADFDVLQRLDTKEYKIIEINPRVPASLRAAAISGVNFPEIIVNDTMGLEVPTYHYSPGKTMRYLGLDIMWFLQSPQRFKANPSWFKFLGHNIYYQDIYKEDPSTWWTWLSEGIKKIGNRNKRLR